MDDYTFEEMLAGIKTIPNLLSTEECFELIGVLEAQGFEELDAAYSKSERDNKRIIKVDPHLAAKIFVRLKPHLAPTLDIGHHSKTLHHHRLLHGKWRLKGLSPKLRFYRYDKGNKFKRHTDFSDHPNALTHRGFQTLLIYLNNVKKGGATQFFVHNGQNMNVEWSITPETGLGAVFHQNMVHSGQVVETPPKYCIRTNIEYVRETPVPELSLDEQTAVRMYNEAANLPTELEQCMQITKAQEYWKDVELYVEGY